MIVFLSVIWIVLSILGLFSTVDMFERKRVTFSNLFLATIGLPGTLVALIIILLNCDFMTKPRFVKKKGDKK